MNWDYQLPAEPMSSCLEPPFKKTWTYKVLVYSNSFDVDESCKFKGKTVT